MEATLALSKTELDGEIGFNLGFGRGVANGEGTWTTRQSGMIDAARRAGLRAFYTASAGQDDGSAGYQWSFLRPLVTLPLPAAASIVPLPEDYHGLEGRIRISSTGSQVYRPIPVVGLNMVQEQYSRTPDMTGCPAMAAILPLKSTSALKGQRFQLYLFPIADQAYSLQFVYFLNCDDISDSRPYPYGGAQHSETIIAACLAAAEQKLDNQAGVQSQRFANLLAGSIAVDRVNKPQTSGYCGDGNRWGDRQDVRRTIYEGESITFDGSQY